MVSNEIIEHFVRDSWVLLRENSDYDKYLPFFTNLVSTCQFSVQNLTISLYYIYKYTKNLIIKVDNSLESNTSVYLVLTSLILSNKTYDDQSYTLKTWVNICNNIKGLEVNLKLLLTLESHFMATLNYEVSFNKIAEDCQFWQHLISNDIWLKSIMSPTNYVNNYPNALATPPPVVRKPVIANTMHTPIYSVSKSSLSTPSNGPMVTTPISSCQYNTHFPNTPITPFSEPRCKKRKVTHQQQQPTISSYVPFAPLPQACALHRFLPINHKSEQYYPSMSNSVLVHQPQISPFTFAYSIGPRS